MASGHGDETRRVRYFNPASEDDEQDLMNWCHFHFSETLKKGMEGFNAATYHDCCMCFSKKGYVKRNSHPPLQSASILKIPSLRNAKSPEELYSWLREKIFESQRLGKRPLFPSINTPHMELDEEEAEIECLQSADLLKKKCRDHFQLQKEFEKKVKQLTEDNQRLLAASKSWCLKYQDLLCSREDDRMSFTEMTPQKALKIDDSNSSFLML